MCPSDVNFAVASSSAASLMSPMTTLAPLRANAEAAASPIPMLAPVTSATWPSKS